MNTIQTVIVPKQIVIGIRRQASFNSIPDLIGKLFRFAMAKGLKVVGPPIYLCHEMTYQAVQEAELKQCADLEVVLPVSEYAEPQDDICSYDLKGGIMAKTTHFGPYNLCESAYGALYSWITKQGKQINGPTREYYLNDPREVRPNEIVTEIYAPIT